MSTITGLGLPNNAVMNNSVPAQLAKANESQADPYNSQNQSQLTELTTNPEADDNVSLTFGNRPIRADASPEESKISQPEAASIANTLRGQILSNPGKATLAFGQPDQNSVLALLS
jgi:hypothetical protein